MARFDSYAGRLFNTGGGLRHSASLRELTSACQKVTGNSISIVPEVETRRADVRIYVTDYRRLTQATGWAPRRNVETVVADVCAWIRGEEAAIGPLLGR